MTSTNSTVYVPKNILVTGGAGFMYPLFKHKHKHKHKHTQRERELKPLIVCYFVLIMIELDFVTGT
jgi:hypothetical protein